MTTFTVAINQVESLYVGYFGRAGDPGGTNYWVNQLQAGTTTLSAIASSFAVQPEATAKYPYLANPTISDPGAFVDQVYMNMFNHVADAAGKAYWVAQLVAASGKPAAIGSMILNIISGATGVDDTTIRNKVDVAQDFTVKASNAGTTWTPAVQAQSSAEIAATNDTAASVTAQKAATDAYIASSPGPQQSFTLGVDTLTASGQNANFNAPLIFNAPGGTLVQSLQTGDSATDTAPLTGTGLSNGGTFTAVLNAGAVPLVTLKGIPTHSVTALASTGYSGDITGLTTFTNNNSTADITIGVAGNGIDKGGVAGTTTTGSTLLSTVNLNNVTGGASSTTIIVNTAALAGAADALTMNFVGAFGGTGAPLTVSVKNDTAAATTADNAYETLSINAAGATFAQLSDIGSGILSTTKINVAGAGAVSLFAGATENYSKLTTIDASTQTGGVTITGANTGGGLVGLLAGNTVLSSFKGGTGADSLDVSSMTAAQVQAFTATNLDGGTGTARDTLILSGAAATTLVAVNNSGFENIGIVGATGIIDFSKFGAGVDTLSFVTEQAAGGVVINNMTSGLTLAVGTFGATANPIALNSTGTLLNDVVNITHTADAASLGAITTMGFETINHTVATGANSSIAALTATASAGGNVTYNLVDNSAGSLTFTAAPNVGTGGTINISGTGTGSVILAAGTTAAAINASALNTGAAATVVGLQMNGGSTSQISVLGSNGRDILVASTVVDTLSGGAGNDDLTGLAGADNITTGTGTDNVFWTAAAQGGNTTTVASATAMTAGDLITDFTSLTDKVNAVTVGSAAVTATGVVNTWNLNTTGGFILTGSALDFVAGVTTAAAVSAAIGTVTGGVGDRAYAAILDNQSTVSAADDVYQIYEVVLANARAGVAISTTDTISLVGTVTSPTFVVQDFVVT